MQPEHVVAIYGEQGFVMLSTTACGVDVLNDTMSQRAGMQLITATADETKTDA